MPNISLARRFRIPALLSRSIPFLLMVLMTATAEALPPLPPELQYRIVGNDLALIDIHASLILDILPYALIDMTTRDSRPQRDVR